MNIEQQKIINTKNSKYYGYHATLVVCSDTGCRAWGMGETPELSEKDAKAKVSALINRRTESADY
ncbi:hypothetical protein A3715_13970 [Oleiphilus sp. HI0009]|nr:hypothetical protein A3715_13970 [Oleiphilus sp. HI0009]